MEQDIKILERMLKIEKECLHYDVSQDEIRAIEHLIKAYKELEEELKEEKELNKIIKNTKLDELFTTPRRNGKTIELAMQLREEILKLPECKLYGIKNCKNKVVLLTKEECIPVSLVEEKIEEYKKKIIEARKEDDDCKEIYYEQEIEIMQELLEKRK